MRSRERRKITCTPAAARKIDAAGLTPVETFDSMAVRFASGFGAQGGDERWTERSFTTLTEVGEACATATSQACADKVAFHPAPLLDSNCLQVCSEWSIVTTRGDEVERWAGPDETIALLAPIDSADEALMVVASHGYDVGCPFETVLGTFLPASEARATITPHEDGFEVNATRTTPISEEDIGNLIIARTTLQVSRAGDLTVLERREYPARITGF